ncbi:MAG TPA: TIGR03621 family F420-dependent LLM class oxidoreductase [Thermomicrobiales bacterium]|nr:TIGR03621 family F420-dependent LLM class oxidoreductase [Thermomicrobiales bacterium]
MERARPFRFAAGAYHATSSVEWAENARRIESYGYDTLSIPDHFLKVFSPTAALTAAACATTTLRMGIAVYDNDFRHPAVLAKETATLDVLSDGRLEMGIGAGWLKDEYDRTGIPFDPPATRVDRMIEAVHVIKGLWSDEPCTFNGRHYQITDLDGWPKPIQRPHPPIMVGAGGKRLLSFAAREADIVGIIAQATPGGTLDTPADTETVLADKVAWIRQEAGTRFESIELSMLIWNLAVTDHPGEGAERIGRESETSPEHVLESPYYLVGSVDTIADRLVELRERFGISYFKIFPRNLVDFAPVVAKLAGS